MAPVRKVPIEPTLVPVLKVLAKDERSAATTRVIQRHAGHEKYSTTKGYVREAEDDRGKLGEVFPPVFKVLMDRSAPAGSNRSGNDQKVKSSKKVAKNGVPKGIRRRVFSHKRGIFGAKRTLGVLSRCAS